MQSLGKKGTCSTLLNHPSTSLDPCCPTRQSGTSVKSTEHPSRGAILVRGSDVGQSFSNIRLGTLITATAFHLCIADMSIATYSSASQSCIQNRANKALKDQNMRPKAGKNGFASNFSPPQEEDSDSSLSDKTDEESRETCYSGHKRPKLSDPPFPSSSSDDLNSLHLRIDDSLDGQFHQYQVPVPETTETTVTIESNYPAPNTRIVSKVIDAIKLNHHLNFICWWELKQSL